jgi:hypothetical protein
MGKVKRDLLGTMLELGGSLGILLAGKLGVEELEEVNGEARGVIIHL